MAPKNSPVEAGEEATVGEVLAEVSLASDITPATPLVSPPLPPRSPNSSPRPDPTPTQSHKRAATPTLVEEDPTEDLRTSLTRNGGQDTDEGGGGSPCQCNARSPDVDGGWAWVVLVAAFLQFFTTSAMYYSFSVFFVEFLQTFQQSRAKTGWVYSTNSAVFMFSGPIGGWFLSRWGARTTLNVGALLAAVGYLGSAFSPSLDFIFFFHGVMNGVGTSLTYSGWIVGLTKFWVRRYAPAMGVAMAGSGCGVLLLGPQIQVLVVHYGWRGAMIIGAGFYLHLLIFAATLYSTQRAPPPCRVLLHSVKSEESESEEEAMRGAEAGSEINVEAQEMPQRVHTRQLLCSLLFCFLAGACFLTIMAITTVFAVLRDLAELQGLGAAFSPALAGSGGGDLLGRVLAGQLSGKGCSPFLLLSGVQLLLAGTIGFATLASTFTQLVVAMTVFGVACGLHSVTNALMPSHLTSGVGIGHVLGCLLFVTGIGALLGPPMTGAMVDLFHSYGPAMTMCTASPAVAALLNVAAYFRHRSRHTQARAGADP